MILSALIGVPFAAALTILCVPRENRLLVKQIAAVAGGLCLAISLAVYFTYNQKAGGFQFVERAPWIPQIGATYFLGVDGISLPLVLLTGFIMFTAILISWNVEVRTKEFFALFLILVAGVFGVFMALDLFLLFIFYELAVLPMYLLIGTWGSTRKEYGAMKLTLYLLVGSAFIFIGMLALYFTAGLRSFDLLALNKVDFSRTFQIWVFPPVFIGFAILGGLWPLHTWSPVGHVAAPTSVSMLHAGVLMKLGAYGCLRVAMFLFPEGAQVWLPWLVVLTLVNVLYGSMVAMVQTDFKFVIGYSSVSHMGFVLMGLATMNENGLTGAVLQMFSHGIMTALFFAIVGRMVYDRTHTRDFDKLGGLHKIMPFANVSFVIAGLASMGLPGLSGFVAELQILIGTWQAYPLAAALSGVAIVVTAAYVLRVTHRVFYGKLDPHFEHLAPITRTEKVAASILMGILIGVGLYPSIMVDMIRGGVGAFLSQTFLATPPVPT